jgi:hypothetical protein
MEGDNLESTYHYQRAHPKLHKLGTVWMHFLTM